MSTNGKLTAAELTTVDGWAELTPNTARAYMAAKAYILAHFGVTIVITAIYGAYRDLSLQAVVKKLFGILAAAVGYSNHGLGIAFDMSNITAVLKAVGGQAALDQIMARFGFVRNAGNGSGGTEQWHYALVAVVDLAGLTEAKLVDPATQPPTQEEIDDMAANQNANFVRDFETESSGTVRTALLYPWGDLVLLNATEDVDNAVLAHVSTFNLPLTNANQSTVRTRYGAQLTKKAFDAFVANFPGEKIGF